MKQIKFYRSSDPYGWMSNFARFPLIVDGKEWPTSEHYYQAQKFNYAEVPVDLVGAACTGTFDEEPVHSNFSRGRELMEEIRQAATPGEAARIGRDPNNPIRPDWDEAKDDVMRRVVKAKFLQHQELGYELVKTGDAELIEHTTNDTYWADGGNGKGKNMLGVILMETREYIRQFTLSEIVESTPGTRGGQPVLRGTRFPVSLVLAEVTEGYDLGEIADNYDLDQKQLCDLFKCLALEWETRRTIDPVI